MTSNLVFEGWIKHWFPEFEFTWLSEEMRENLPKEMNFVHEASNAERTVREFKHVRTALYIRASICHVDSHIGLT